MSSKKNQKKIRGAVRFSPNRLTDLEKAIKPL
jgi:hypothetical protein